MRVGEGVALFTGSWRTPIDDGMFVRVGISRSTRGVPKGFRRLTDLEPGPWFASIPDPVEWAKRYDAEMLSRLDPARVVGELRAMSDGVRPIVLLCWERSDGSNGWCHRSLVSVWFRERLGIVVPELGDSACRCGRAHPLLAEALRRA
jgi:hypothetical protein